jgi:DNA-directed RNA polymerase specialized sigma24 family protein
LDNSIEKAIKEIETAFRNEQQRSKSWINVAGKYLKFYGSNGFENHYTAEDIVMELINKLLNGERNWDIEKVPDFDHFMYQNIQSIVEGKLRSRKIVESVDSFKPNAKAGKVFRGLKPGQYADNRDTGELIDLKNKLERCYNELSGDDECGLVFLEWLQGKTSIEISESLGITVNDVERIKKRIKYQFNNKLS